MEAQPTKKGPLQMSTPNYPSPVVWALDVQAKEFQAAQDLADRLRSNESAYLNQETELSRLQNRIDDLRSQAEDLTSKLIARRKMIQALQDNLSKANENHDVMLEMARSWFQKNGQPFPDLCHVCGKLAEKYDGIRQPVCAAHAPEKEHHPVTPEEARAALESRMSTYREESEPDQAPEGSDESPVTRDDFPDNGNES